MMSGFLPYLPRISDKEDQNCIEAVSTFIAVSKFHAIMAKDIMNTVGQVI